MKKEYELIFTTALSAIDYNKKIDLLKKIWPKINEVELFDLAKNDEVACHIADALNKTDLEYLPQWNIEYEQVKNRIDILMDELEQIAVELKHAKIDIVALKNAGITKAIYRNHGCSPMGDIDLLISSINFKKAHSIIIKNLGYTFKFRSEFEKEDYDSAFRGGGTEYFKDVNNIRVWLELQWRPIAGRWIQPHNEPDGDELMKSSLDVENSAVRILSPEFNLLQVALHTAKHSYVRAPGFRLHSDVDRIIRFQKIDWNSFLTLVKRKKVKTAVYFSLFYAKYLLGTPIKSKHMNQIKPIFYRRFLINFFIKKAGFYGQNSKKFSRTGYIIFTLSLYDSVFDNLRAIFPSFKTLKIKYPIKSRFQIPIFYLIRIKDLLFKRAKL